MSADRSRDRDRAPSSGVQRVYGRGMLDGLRMAGVADAEQLMSDSRLQRATQNLTGVARKVLEAVRTDKPCSAAHVTGFLARAGVRVDHRTVVHALGVLFERGLVVESTPNHFVRAEARRVLTLATNRGSSVTTQETPKPAAKPATPAPAQPTPAPTPEPPRTFDALDALAQLAATSRSLASQMEALATEIENVALSVQEQMHDSGKETVLLQQFQALVRGIKAS